MTELFVAHTGQLDTAVLRAGRDLLQDVFAGELTDDDWEHCLGGLHALLWEDGELVGHAALIQRRLLHGGRSLRTGYVEGVGVRADRRRRGYGATVMEALEQVARRLWRGPTSALTPNGVVRTEAEDDCIYVLPLSAPLDLHGALTCDWRNGDAW